MAKNLDKTKKTIYVDLDGTLVGKNGSLLHNHLGELSTSSIDGINKAHDNNCEIIIATGRDIYRTADFARVLGLNKFIAEAGCVIKTQDEVSLNFGEAIKYLISIIQPTKNFIKKLLKLVFS